MYICTHACTPGTTALQRLREQLMQKPEAPHVSFVRRTQTTFSTSNATTLLYPFPETPIPLNPPSPLPNIPQNSSRTAASAVLLFYTNQRNRVHHSDEFLRSFTVAPCVVVEKLEGKQRFSRAPVGRHAGRQSPRKTKVTVHVKRKVNEELGNQIPQQLSHHHNSVAPRQHPLITLVLSRSAQFMAHPSCWSWRLFPKMRLHWCQFRGFF